MIVKDKALGFAVSYDPSYEVSIINHVPGDNQIHVFYAAEDIPALIGALQLAHEEFLKDVRADMASEKEHTS